MFDQMLVENTVRTRRPLAIVLSLAGQVFVASLTILLPLLRTEMIGPSRMLRLVSVPLRNGEILTQVSPVYPALAKQARISGVVRLEAVISRNGFIESLRVKSGHPLLTGAAVDAVRKWIYRPTLLNGEPVEVLTEIEVNFKLNQ